MTTTLGAILVVAVLTDVVTTTVNITDRSGHLTRVVLAASRRTLGALFPGGARPSLALAQVVVLIATWTSLLWLAWWLVLVGEPLRFVDTVAGVEADALDTLYVAGFGVFALGVGDIAPASRAAQLLLPLSSATGLILVTLEITYLLALTQAVAHKRRVARMLHTLGDDAPTIVRHAWTGASFDPARESFTALVTEMALLTEHQLAFPMLYEIGARRQQLAVAPRLVSLLDALQLMHDRAAPSARLPEATYHQLLRSIEDLAASTPVGDREVATSDQPGAAVLEELGVPQASDPPVQRLDGLRHRLHVLAAEEGWPVGPEPARR